MAYDRLAVRHVPGGSIPGIEKEQFILVLLDSSLPQRSFMQSSYPLTETELRAELQQRGCTQLEIASHIQHARTRAL
jgi:hypothetical protein